MHLLRHKAKKLKLGKTSCNNKISYSGFSIIMEVRLLNMRSAYMYASV